jgi:hypothetical protein
MMQSGRFRWRPSILALAVAGGLLGLPAEVRCAAEYGRITLNSGEAVRASVAKEVGEVYILRTPDGLRVVPKSAVAKIETASGDPPLVSPTVPLSKTAPAPEGKKAASKTTEKVAVRETEPKSPPPPPTSSVREIADPRIEEARAAGKGPTVEIDISGSVDGKALLPDDGLIHSKVSFFLTEESKPAFEILSPAEKVRPKPASKAAKATPRAEYVAQVTAETQFTDQTFYGQPTVKLIHTLIRFNLVRADGTVIVQANEVDDEVGDPDHREEGCRASFVKSVEALLARLKELKTFGGSPGGSE